MAAKKRRRGRGEGAVFYSASKGAWVARLPVGRLPSGKVKYRELSAASKAEVLARLRKAEDDRRGGVPEASRLTVADYLSRWLEGVVRPHAEARTYETYEANVRVHLAPALGHLTLAGLSPQDVEAFYAALRLSASAGVARKAGAVLGAALNHAARRGLIARAPTGLVRRPREARVEVEPFTPGEVKAILAEAEGRPRGCFFIVALATGMRLGELLGLGWQHIDLDAATARVERAVAQLRGGERRLKGPKSQSGHRTVSLSDFAVEALRRHRREAQERGRMALPVFSTPSGRPPSRASVSRSWKRLLRRAGVPYRKFHNARHTHVSLLLSQGVPLVEVARRVGDRPETILRHYAHFLPSHKGAAGVLQSLLGGGESTPTPPSP